MEQADIVPPGRLGADPSRGKDVSGRGRSRPAWVSGRAPNRMYLGRMYLGRMYPGRKDHASNGPPAANGPLCFAHPLGYHIRTHRQTRPERVSLAGAGSSAAARWPRLPPDSIPPKAQPPGNAQAKERHVIGAIRHGSPLEGLWRVVVTGTADVPSRSPKGRGEDWLATPAQPRRISQVEGQRAADCKGDPCANLCHGRTPARPEHM